MLEKTSKEKEFVQLIKASQGVIHRVCRMYCDDETHRQDLFQEILIQLWKSFSSFKGKSKFSSWMYRVALNVALQDLRATKKKKQLFTSVEGIDIIAEENQSGIQEERIKQVHKAITGLSKVEKAIVMLHLEEKNNEEIAEIIGISQNYVRVRMSRIREKLKKNLNP